MVVQNDRTSVSGGALDERTSVSRSASERLSEPPQLYCLPVTYLPADSALPVALPMSVASGRGQGDLDAVVESASRMKRTLQETLVTPAQLAHLLERLWQPMAAVAAAPIDADESPPTFASLTTAAPDFSPVMAAACAIYDQYFGVVRVEPLTLSQFTTQVARTCLALLPDLPHTLLDRAQLNQLIATMMEMFSVLAERGQETGGQDTTRHPLLATHHSPPATLYQQAWQSTDPADRAWCERVAFYRWKVGHHFFNWCAIFCRDALVQAHAAIAADDIDRGAAQLGQAECFLRGSTAAMWYAGDFPARLYQTVIRPSMIMPGAPAGFSGDQNADYNRMKTAKQELKGFLRAHYGQDLVALPSMLRHALLQFHEADIQDNEHHLLIAAQKVGTDQSLAQKEWQAELPAHVYRQHALDILRQMAEMKRREFGG